MEGEAETAEPGGRRILVIDDECDVRLVLREGLCSRGFQVDEAADAEQALSLARQRRPDAVVSDIEMPGADGLEAVLAIRSLYRGLPVVYVSGKAPFDRSIEGVVRDNAAFISKPVDLDELVWLLVRGLGRREGAEPPPEKKPDS